MPNTTRKSGLGQLKGLKRRVTKKPIGSGPSYGSGSGTGNPMGKDRVRDRRIKKLYQMMEKKSPYLKQEGPKKSLPPKSRSLRPEARKTGGVKPGGFRKPTFNRKRVKTGS